MVFSKGFFKVLRFFVPQNDPEKMTRRFVEKHFTHAVGWPRNKSPFYKYFTHAVGFSIQTFPFRRKHFSLRLISNGGKMERMPLICAMGLLK